MSVNSRNKGATFEREVAKILNSYFDSEKINYICKRNLDQYQTNNLCDINIPYHAVDCNFYKSGDWYQSGWWEQVCAAADQRIPVLVFKYNRKPIRVCVPLHAINPEWPVNNDAVTVMDMDKWLEVLKKNWKIYEEKSTDPAC